MIGVSANSDSDTEKAALDAGMNDFVCKPLTLAVFEKVVSRLLQRVYFVPPSQCRVRGRGIETPIAHRRTNLKPDVALTEY